MKKFHKLSNCQHYGGINGIEKLGPFATPSGEEDKGCMTVITHTTHPQEIKWEVKHSQSKDVSTAASKLKEVVSQVLLLPADILRATGKARCQVGGNGGRKKECGG